MSGSRYGLVAAIVVACFAIVACPVAVLAQSTIEQIVDARQENFKEIGRTFRALKDELHHKMPDGTAVSDLAGKLNALAAHEAQWFPPGSGKDGDGDSSAKTEIWSDPTGFAAAITALQIESAKFQRLSAGRDVEPLNVQLRSVGQTCENCHSAYRSNDWF